MANSENDFSAPLAPHVVKRVIARAATTDAAHEGTLTISQIQEIALEVGISDAAVREALEQHALVSRARAPFWVRLGMSGVPDRVTAMRFYWFFIAVLCASPLVLLKMSTGPTGLRIFMALAAMGLVAAWNTSSAVRWLDRHGWHRL